MHPHRPYRMMVVEKVSRPLLALLVLLQRLGIATTPTENFFSSLSRSTLGGAFFTCSSCHYLHKWSSMCVFNDIHGKQNMCAKSAVRKSCFISTVM